jgi:type I restriction enzyme S subunit
MSPRYFSKFVKGKVQHQNKRPDTEEVTLKRSLIKVRLSSECEPKWVVNWLLSLDGRTCIRDVASSTSGFYTLSVGKVSALPVPLPPLDEQRRIITEVDRRISIISEIETEVETNLMRAERMRQSILKSAFLGKSIGW